MKILYIATLSGTINAFLVPHIQMLIDLGHKVDIACNITTPIDESLLSRGCRVFEIEFERSPLKRDNYQAYNRLKKVIRDEGYDVVHTHTPVASACARLACRNMENVKVFYTAHGFHFFKGAPIKNWLMYYPIEKWLAKYTNVLITINREDYRRAKGSFKGCRVKYIPGVGLDTRKFSDVEVNKLAKRDELGVPREALIVLSVGELNTNKNHETVIKAIAKLNNQQIHYVICGNGALESHLACLSENLGLSNQVHLVGFRRDVVEICKVSDVFAFPSFREGLPVALMEAMACGLPVICSNIRGNTDLIEDGKGGYFAMPDDIEGFANNINRLINGAKIRSKMSAYNKSIINQFDRANVLKNLRDLYKSES